ncbi:MAG: FGGY family carbohydrate kinase [Actinomycetota bacterium]|nr:FGGY family carbohydrate kinase [Actinomycetota bacterium]
MTSEAFVGLDLGTSALKGVLVSAGGDVVTWARSAYPTERPAPGRAEQDPNDWLRVLGDVVGRLSAEVPSSSWRGIGLSGMIPTLVTVDARGEATGAAITWEDARAEEEGREFRASVGAEELYRSTGQWVDGRYLVPMLRWIERNDPQRGAATDTLLGARDFLFAWMTGERATDPSTATGFGCYRLTDGTWMDPGFDVRLPQVRHATDASPMLEEPARQLGLPEGIAVTLGCADSVAAAFALGVRGPGDCAYVWGTSTVLLGVDPEPRTDPAHRYLVTPLATGSSFGLEMDLLSTGAALEWCAKLLGVPGTPAVLELASRSERGANGAWFLPYLAFGEQGALWDPDLRGTLGGLTTRHAKEDVARALVEGIVLESRRCVEVLDGSDAAPTAIRVTGSIANSSFFLQQLADATARPILPFPIGSAAALGAAMLASGQEGTTGAAERIEHDPATAGAWSDLYRRHDERLTASRRVRGSG